MIEARLGSDLPERFAQLYDYKTGKFETPLDGQGIADIDATFELAVRTYPETLPDLCTLPRNRHHLYWTEGWWKSFANQQKNDEERQVVHSFRNSAPQIAYVPLTIHRWIEMSQIPPPPPSMQVMRARNLAWQSASLLLKSAERLDVAKKEYGNNKGKPRQVISHIPGITPRFRRLSDTPYELIEVLDDMYWLSELENRLEGWQSLAKDIGTLSLGQGILETPRLSDVRNLRSRLRRNALIPNSPDSDPLESAA